MAGQTKGHNVHKNINYILQILAGLWYWQDVTCFYKLNFNWIFLIYMKFLWISAIGKIFITNAPIRLTTEALVNLEITAFFPEKKRMIFCPGSGATSMAAKASWLAATLLYWRKTEGRFRSDWMPQPFIPGKKSWPPSATFATSARICGYSRGPRKKISNRPASWES